MPVPAETGSNLKDDVPLNLKKHQGLNGNQRAID
jgi:hypothetical protein